MKARHPVHHGHAMGDDRFCSTQPEYCSASLSDPRRAYLPSKANRRRYRTELLGFKHNVTGDVSDFANFERARRGVGPDAVVSKAQRLGDQQDLAARRAVDGVARDLSDGLPADQLDAAQAVTARLQTMSEAERAAAQAAYRAV